ncbi:hypothetical protein P9112_010540 [Eukaryota sp. TZLM1-RC]
MNLTDSEQCSILHFVDRSLEMTDMDASLSIRPDTSMLLICNESSINLNLTDSEQCSILHFVDRSLEMTDMDAPLSIRPDTSMLLICNESSINLGQLIDLLTQTEDKLKILLILEDSESHVLKVFKRRLGGECDDVVNDCLRESVV